MHEDEYTFRYLYPHEVEEARRLEGTEEEDADWLSDTEKRVNFIYELIASNRFVRGKTYKELAIVWGLGKATVTQYASEAYRRFKAAIRDPEEIRQELLARLDSAMGEAMNHKKAVYVKEKVRDESGTSETGRIEYVPDPQYMAAIKAADSMAKLVGLDVKKHEHTHRSEYTEVDLEELAEIAIAKLNGEDHGRPRLPEPRREEQRPRRGAPRAAGEDRICSFDTEGAEVHEPDRSPGAHHDRGGDADQDGRDRP